MMSRLTSRVERLEGRAKAKQQNTIYLYGWMTPLPKEFTGERHVVETHRQPTSSRHFFWCQFEERPGPAPPGSDEDAAYLTK
jgi:hypothetical protein